MHNFHKGKVDNMLLEIKQDVYVFVNYYVGILHYFACITIFLYAVDFRSLYANVFQVLHPLYNVASYPCWIFVQQYLYGIKSIHSGIQLELAATLRLKLNSFTLDIIDCIFTQCYLVQAFNSNFLFCFDCRF